ncbi:MAG: hypothetical protein WCC60_03875 [Ilumatobacteraceae bacterium]
MEFAIRYDGPSGVLIRALGMGPHWSGVVLDESELRVRLGWGFRARIPRSSITTATRNTGRYFSRGAHGWRGRWLVNGAGRGLVTITIDPHARAYTMGFPLRLRELTISLEAPDELIEALAVR